MDAELLYELVVRYGYPASFIAGLLSHVIPFIALPYLTVVWTLSKTLNPVILGVLSGLGAGIGKLSSYYVGLQGGRLIAGSKRSIQLDALKGLIKNYGALAAFIASITPLPDDVFLIPLGMMKYELWKYLAATISGKVLLCLTVATAGRLMGGLLDIILGEGGVYSFLASILIVAALIYLVFKIDWVKLTGVLSVQGWQGLVNLVAKEGLKALIVKKQPLHSPEPAKARPENRE
ncbi:MAG: VTT domain-containing protein [Candidatus Nezhaarchaeales archaeon]